MPRLPVMALIAALVIATTAVILIRVVPINVFAPPIVSPSYSITVPAGSPASYIYSASASSVSSNVSVDFRLASLLGAPYVAISGPLPQDTKIVIQYRDPVTGSSYTFTLINRSTTGKTYYVLNTYPSGCSNYGSIGYIDSLVGYPYATAVVVRTAAGSYILYPNLTEVGYISVDTNGITVYKYDGTVWVKCNWHKTYLGTTGYTLSTDNTVYNFVFGEKSLSIAVRPIIIGAVWANSDAHITISLS